MDYNAENKVWDGTVWAGRIVVYGFRYWRNDGHYDSRNIDGILVKEWALLRWKQRIVWVSKV